MRGVALAAALVLAACAREAPPSGPLLPISCTSNGQTGDLIGFSMENITLVGQGRPRRVVIMTHFDRIGYFDDKPPSSHAAMGRFDTCDFSGRFVSAGLIDSHVHLATQPQQTEEEVTQRLRNAMFGGVTSVRDMGGRGDLVMRWATASEDGSIEAPRIYYSALITGPDSDFWLSGATGEYVSLGAPGRQPWFYRIDSTTDLSAMLHRMHDAGVTGIKVHSGLDAALLARLGVEMNPPPPPPSDVQYRALPPQREPSSPRPAMFWSHAAIGPAVPSDAINSGVTAFSHADMLSFEGMRGAGPEFWSLPYAERITRAMRETPANGRVIGNLIQLMKRNDVILEPTLFVIAMAAAQAREEGSPDLARYEAQYAYAVEVTRRAHRAGVRIAAGTDALGGETPNIHAELYLLVRDAGLSPQQALVAATENNADIIPLQHIGLRDRPLVDRGQPADLIIYDRDPTADIRNTQSISAVVVRGRLIQRTTPLSPAPLTEP